MNLNLHSFRVANNIMAVDQGLIFSLKKNVSYLVMLLMWTLQKLLTLWTETY